MTPLVAEFVTPAAMNEGIRAARRGGVGRGAIGVYTPFDVDGTAEALELPRSPVPLLTLAAGLCGVLFAVGLQWFVTAVDFPLNVGGRPVNPILAYVPVTIEIGILATATGAFVALLGLCDLPTPWHPLFEVDGFERASGDRYFLRVASDDPAIEQALRDAGAVAVRRMEAT